MHNKPYKPLQNNKLAFHSTADYPQLESIAADWLTIKKEAIHSLGRMSYIADNRINKNEWRVLPLLPEEEDRNVIQASEIEAARTHAPNTCKLLDSIEGIHAYAFSSLAPNATIKAHQHHNPYVTAMLSLQAAGEVYIENDGERRYFKEGELLVFDYTLVHQVVNNSDTERIVLLILMDNALL